MVAASVHVHSEKGNFRDTVHNAKCCIEFDAVKQSHRAIQQRDVAKVRIAMAVDHPALE